MIRKYLIRVLLVLLRKPGCDASEGEPFCGMVKCGLCGNMWDLFAPQGVNPDVELTCEKCGNERAVLV